jgi:hypothetical protein
MGEAGFMLPLLLGELFNGGTEGQEAGFELGTTLLQAGESLPGGADLFVPGGEAGFGLGGIMLEPLEPGGLFLLPGGEGGELPLCGGKVGVELLESGGFFFALLGQCGDGGEPLLMGGLSLLNVGQPAAELLFHGFDGLCGESRFGRGTGECVCGGFEIEDGGEGAEGEAVTLNEATGLDSLLIDEGAGGGAEITQLKAATGMGEDFGMLEGETVVIDHHVIVIATSESEALREGNDHFLSVFECKGKFGHDFLNVRAGVVPVSMSLRGREANGL